MKLFFFDRHQQMRPGCCYKRHSPVLFVTTLCCLKTKCIFLVDILQILLYSSVFPWNKICLLFDMNFHVAKCSMCNIIGWMVFFLWKESLNSDGQQFHQYQQSEEFEDIKGAIRITSHLKAFNTNNTTTYDVGNPGPDLRQSQNW